MGFESYFFGRADHADIDLRKSTKTMEMNWHASKSLGLTMFTHILERGYGPPGGMCWDISCDDDPIQVTILDAKSTNQSISTDLFICKHEKPEDTHIYSVWYR